MEELMVEVQTPVKLGEEWVEAIIAQDFNRLTMICQPDVISTLMVPKRIFEYDNAFDLSTRIEDWFGEYDSIEKVHTRVALVGAKLGIFYRLSCKGGPASYTIEQQVYCTLRDGRISQLKLLCSGFQPDDVLVDAAPASYANTMVEFSPSTTQPAPQAQALLEFTANGAEGSTCALLTPHIKQKLGELSSGQVLEVHVDDITAKEDIEAWSRLSGNSILKMDQTGVQGLVFYISKK